MHELIIGTVATGEGAFCSGHDFTPVSELPDEPRDDVNNASHPSSSPLCSTQEDEAAVIISCPYCYLDDNNLLFYNIDAMVAAAPASVRRSSPSDRKKS